VLPIPEQKQLGLFWRGVRTLRPPPVGNGPGSPTARRASRADPARPN